MNKQLDSGGMVSAATGLVQSVLSASVEAQRRFAAEGTGSLVAAAVAISRATASDYKVLAFGNGGSAGDAQHFVAELVGRFETIRKPMAAIALTADSSVLTAVANDFGYEQVFARQVQALGVAGDVVVGISTSGRSVNVERALRVARDGGMLTIALTGRDGGPVGQAAAIHVNVREESTARVQEVHRVILHAICAYLDAQRSTGAEPDQR